MISILIPVYNFDVNKLVKSLHEQCSRLGVEFEIRVYDDASTKVDLNFDQLSLQESIVIKMLHKNIGRSAIRNLMAKEAKYDRVLFLDCDSEICDENFIQNYLKEDLTKKIINGGRIYKVAPPSDPNLKLHWSYGVKYESRNLKDRKANPVIYFHSNNFMSSKALMLEHPFDENYSGYGYEDLAWAYNLQKQNFKIIHIDNPVIHLGLEETSKFLDKNIKALSNLPLSMETPLTRMARRILKYKLTSLVFTYYRFNEKRILKNLYSESPNLFYFQLYKLVNYLQELKKSK